MTEDYDLLLARTKRAIRHSLLKRALAMPLLLLAASYFAFQEVGDLDEVGLGEWDVPLIIVITLVRIVRVAFGMWDAYKGSGVVLLTGEVLGRSQLDIELIFHRLADINARWLFIDARERVVMKPVAPAVADAGETVMVSVPRRIFRRLSLVTSSRSPAPQTTVRSCV